MVWTTWWARGGPFWTTGGATVTCAGTVCAVAVTAAVPAVAAAVAWKKEYVSDCKSTMFQEAKYRQSS